MIRRPILALGFVAFSFPAFSQVADTSSSSDTLVRPLVQPSPEAVEAARAALREEAEEIAAEEAAANGDVAKDGAAKGTKGAKAKKGAKDIAAKSTATKDVTAKDARDIAVKDKAKGAKGTTTKDVAAKDAKANSAGAKGAAAQDIAAQDAGANSPASKNAEVTSGAEVANVAPAESTIVEEVATETVAVKETVIADPAAKSQTQASLEALEPASKGSSDLLSKNLGAAILRHAQANGVPERLVRRIVMIESKGNPRASHRGNLGLMQIRLGTAKALGYSGTADGLLDAETNLTYAVRYLAGAYKVAGGNEAKAIGHYQRGYYYEAKRMKLQQRQKQEPLRLEAFATYTRQDAIPRR